MKSRTEISREVILLQLLPHWERWNELNKYIYTLKSYIHVINLAGTFKLNLKR